MSPLFQRKSFPTVGGRVRETARSGDSGRIRTDLLVAAALLHFDAVGRLEDLDGFWYLSLYHHVISKVGFNSFLSWLLDENRYPLMS
jgi:hypothetical protein